MNFIYEEIDNRIMKDIIFRAIVLIGHVDAANTDAATLKSVSDDLKNSIEAYYKVIESRKHE